MAESNPSEGAVKGSGFIGGRPDETWWMAQIRRGIAFRRKHTHQSRWDVWRDYYRGKWPPKVLPVNLFFRMMRTVVPRVYFRNPSISVMPAKPGIEQQAFAKLIERIDNKLIRTMRVKQQIKMITQQTWLTGTGVGKRGFGEEFHPTPDIFSSADGPLVDNGKTPRRVEYNTGISPNQPWFLQNPTGDFIVPAGSRNFQECRWYASWYRRPLNDVQEDPRFKNTKGLNSSSGQNDARALDPNAQPDERMVDLVEVRDTATRTSFVIAPYGGSGNKILFFGDDTMQVNNRTPYYTVVFNPDDEVCWGVPDSMILEPQQLELNEVRSLQMKHRRLALIKILYKKNSINIEEFEKLLNGEVAAAVEISGELSDIDNFQVADIPQSLIVMGREILEDVREGMGFSRNQFGNYAEGSADRTATESKIVAAASEIRVDERRDTIADMIVDLFEDIHCDIFDRWTDEMVVEVAGPTGLPLWVAFKPAMLKGAVYELNVDPDSSVPQTKEMREQKALITYERLKSNPLINPELLTQYMLHELHGVNFDKMMRSLAQLQQGAGQPGSGPGTTPDNPMNVQQFMQMLAGQGQSGQGA